MAYEGHDVVPFQIVSRRMLEYLSQSVAVLVADVCSLHKGISWCITRCMHELVVHDRLGLISHMHAIHMAGSGAFLRHIVHLKVCLGGAIQDFVRPCRSGDVAVDHH